MKTIAFISLLQLSCALVTKRDGPESLDDFEKPKAPASAIGQFLKGLTDIEPILKMANPIIGSFWRNPIAVGALANSFLPKVKLRSQSELKPKLRPDAKRAIFRYGPFEMTGQGVCDNHRCYEHN